MIDQTPAPEQPAEAPAWSACRTSRHCADHGWCHRCAPNLAPRASAILKAVRAAGLDEAKATDMYEVIAEQLRLMQNDEHVRVVPAPAASGASAEIELTPEQEARNATSGIDTPGCDCGHDGMGAGWHINCTWKRGYRPDTTQAETCPGYETTPNPCRCPCEGCKHNCSAHQIPAPAGLRDQLAAVLWPLTDWDGDRLNAEAAADHLLPVVTAWRDRELQEAHDLARRWRIERGHEHDRAEQAEAAVARYRDSGDPALGNTASGYQGAISRIRAALDTPQET